jgi:hypothetical protein
VPFTILQSKLVSVTFTIKNVPKDARSNLYLTGNALEIGQWKTDTKTAAGPFLCPHAPDCFLDISVPTGRPIEFKFFHLGANGSVEREGGANHIFTAPADSTGSNVVEWNKE